VDRNSLDGTNAGPPEFLEPGDPLSGDGVTMKHLFLFALMLMPAVADAQTSADFFDSQNLQEVRLFINSRDLRDLRERYTDNTYYPADFLWRGVRIRNVAVRVRGLSTRSGTKPGLRIDFNRYVTGQTFLGLSSVVLDNVLNDASQIRERISMGFIDHMGQPASRESVGRLYINNAYQGFYTFVEAVDASYLARTLGENAGYLFDYHFTTGFYGEDLGDDLQAYKLHFEPQTHRLDPDTILYSPIRDLFREINHDVDAAWRDRVGEYIDLPQFVTYLAIETFLSEDDGFLGTAGMANFYLYRPSDRNAHRLLPWDRDTALQQIDSPIFNRVENNVLARRALAFADLRSLYLDVLEQCARAAADDRWLEREVDRVSGLVKDVVHEDAFKTISNEQFDEGIAFLLNFAAQRPGYVLAEVAKARTASAR
jgi:spore coat protein H